MNDDKPDKGESAAVRAARMYVAAKSERNRLRRERDASVCEVAPKPTSGDPDERCWRSNPDPNDWCPGCDLRQHLQHKMWLASAKIGPAYKRLKRAVERSA